MSLELRDYPVDELLSEGEVPIDWIWEPFLPTGAFTTLSAYMKVGKSTFVYKMISAIVKGEAFCGYPTTKTPVLLLAVEENKREVVNRLIRSGVVGQDPVRVHVGPLAATLTNYAALSNTITKHGIGLIVLDTLSQFWNIEDENDNAQALRALAPLLEVTRSTAATAVLVHHNGKMDVPGGRAIRGASAVFGMMDQALILKNHGSLQSNFRRLECFGRYSETPTEIIIRLNPETGVYELIGDADEASLHTLQWKLREFLLSHPGGHTVASMIDATALKKGAILRALASPQPWFCRSGDGVKGKPYTYTGVIEGGVLVDPLIEEATLEALDLSHLMD